MSNTTSDQTKSEPGPDTGTEGRRRRRHDGDGDEKDLTGVYGAVQSGIWLVGLAILFWTGDWFPGILILVAISGITQAVLQGMAKQRDQQAQAAEAQRATAEAQRVAQQAAAQSVPANCPTCGAAISASTVVWTTPTTAQCPYCKAAVPLTTKV